MGGGGSQGRGLATKCLELCQALSHQGGDFSFALNTGSGFTFSIDSKKQVKREYVEPEDKRGRTKEEYMELQGNRGRVKDEYMELEDERRRVKEEYIGPENSEVKVELAGSRNIIR